MKILTEAKPYLITTCISFTIVTLVQAFLSMINNMDMPLHVTYQIFLICCVVNFAIYINDYLHISSSIIKHFINIIDVILIVLLMNIFVFKTTSNIDFLSLVVTSVVLALVYIGVCIIIGFRNAVDAKKINEKIKKRQNL